MGTGSQINSGTSSSGAGGNIAITAGDTISISGTLSTGQPGGIQSRSIGSDTDAGSGGSIALTAGHSVTISDGASVSASSTGPGNTGNIVIDAGHSFFATNSSVTTQANQAVAERDTLPAEPGSWLASPLVMMSTTAGQRAKSEESMFVSRGENPLLSLRQIAPAGFLTQAFAADWSAGCQS